MYKVYTTYGVWTAILLIAYFLVIKLIGWHQYPTLSAVNGLIFGLGIYLALKKLSIVDPDAKYEKGFEVGFLSGVIASVMFTVFMAIYMYQIDTDFADNIMKRWNMEDDLSVFMLLITVLIMGIVTSLILTFSFMQLFKKSWNTKDGNRNTL